jgi:cytochrome c-type biogenesis protein CcmH
VVSRRRALAMAAAACVVALALAAGARAAEEPAPTWHQQLWTGLMSPFCPGRVLIDCPSPQAAELRAWIADQERAGRSRADVEAQLYSQFGDVILQAPKAQGFGLAAYVVPLVAFACGGALVWLFLRRQRRAVSAPAPLAAADPEIERQIDEELARP